MDIKLLRYSDNGDDTLGILFDETGKVISYTLEDEHRAIKVKGETRIPDGTYKLGIRNEITPMTQRYLDDKRLKPWFERHIEILNVPKFAGIYIHIGNFDEDTDGCILLGNNPNINSEEKGKISDSVVTYKKFYNKYYPLLKQGKGIFIKISSI